MNYLLQNKFAGPRGVPTVNITEQEYQAIENAWNTILQFKSFTETYRIVLESYRHVEKAKHDAELDFILYDKLGHQDFSDKRVLLNSAIIGYFSSSRLFRDSTNKILNKLLDIDSRKKFNKFKSDIFETQPEIRFIEAFRNYSQHFNGPISEMTIHLFLEDKSKAGASDLVTSLSINVKQEALLKDNRFNKEALKDMPEIIDIILCIRFHMEGVWLLHNYVITNHSSYASLSREILDNYIKRFENETKENSIALYAIATDQTSSQYKEVPLLLYLDDERLAAINKLADLTNLHKRYITGKIIKK
jgi:hypothetical protein